MQKFTLLAGVALALGGCAGGSAVADGQLFCAKATAAGPLIVAIATAVGGPVSVIGMTAQAVAGVCAAVDGVPVSPPAVPAPTVTIGGSVK
jgi:hypothetical protein